jgi:hypothetical protein
MKTDFKSQYLHPLWQKRRLEMLQAAGFKCPRCTDMETTLHVHHKHYVKGRKVWEYADDELEVLCEPCHEGAHQVKSEATALMAGLDPDIWADTSDLLTGWFSFYYSWNAEFKPPQGHEWTLLTHAGFLASILHFADFETVLKVDRILREDRDGGFTPKERELWRRGEEQFSKWRERIEAMKQEQHG